MNLVNKLLNSPLVYKLSQLIFAPASKILLSRHIRDLIRSLPRAKKLLDVGCGPASWLWGFSLSPVGIDISYEYSKAFVNNGGSAITGSASLMPYHDGVFNGVWCIGVLHHLHDKQAEQAIQEMLRVCHPDGYVVIQDAVLPISKLRRPIAAFVRSIDRGKNMRSAQDLLNLLPKEYTWETRRFTYTLNGLEMLECVTRNTSLSYNQLLETKKKSISRFDNREI